MKALLFILILPFFNPPISYRQLTWSDFKGKPTNDHAASTCTGIVIEKDTAYAVFEPDRSWTRTASAEVLAHEQLHFKISAMWAARVSYELKTGNKDILTAFLGSWELLQQRYDYETNHGQDTAAQRRWEEQIKL